MISFSGIDCSGKSTQIEKVIEQLEKEGYKCAKIWSRGGYTPVLECLKSIIRSDKGADEKEHELYREKVHSSSSKRKLLLWLSIFDMIFYYGVYFRLVELTGKTIIADRYIWDSYIDFKLKYPEYNFESWLVWKALVKMHLKPRVALIYTIPAEMSMQRSLLKNEPFPETVEMRQIRIEKYMQEIETGRWKNVIDATGTIDEVFEETMRIIKNSNVYK